MQLKHSHRKVCASPCDRWKAAACVQP